MARAHLRAVLIDASGNSVAGQQVYIYQSGTSTAPTGNMYNASVGGSIVTNPRSSDASGVIEVWLDYAQAIDYVYTDTAGSHRIQGESGQSTSTLTATTGLPSDSETGTATDGGGAVDTTNSLLYTRSGGRYLRQELTAPTPTDFAGCYAWYDGDEQISIGYAPGQNTQVLVDTSGSNRHLGSFSTSPRGQTVQTNVLNGHAVIRFDAIDDFVENSTYPYPVALVQPYTIVFAGKVSAAGTLIANTAAGNTPRIKAESGGSWSIAAGGTTATASAWDTNNHVICAVFNSTASKFYVDGTQTYSGSTAIGTEALSGVRFNHDFTPAPDLASLSVFSVALSTADIKSVTRALGQKLGITVA